MVLASLLPILSGCTMPEIILPMRLYDLKEANIIEVVLHQLSREHGTITPRGGVSQLNEFPERFEGEYVFFDFFPNPIVQLRSPTKRFEETEGGPESIDFAELYGFSKYADARPVGTGILVGSNGTVIEIVFYKISPDRRTGDGVARDNKGRSYRIFLSAEGS